MIDNIIIYSYARRQCRNTRKVKEKGTDLLSVLASDLRLRHRRSKSVSESNENNYIQS